MDIASCGFWCLILIAPLAGTSHNDPSPISCRGYPQLLYNSCLSITAIFSCSSGLQQAMRFHEQVYWPENQPRARLVRECEGIGEEEFPASNGQMSTCQSLSPAPQALTRPPQCRSLLLRGLTIWEPGTGYLNCRESATTVVLPIACGACWIS